jgi:hypothetical protein
MGIEGGGVIFVFFYSLGFRVRQILSCDWRPDLLLAPKIMDVFKQAAKNSMSIA